MTPYYVSAYSITEPIVDRVAFSSLNDALSWIADTIIDAVPGQYLPWRVQVSAGTIGFAELDIARLSADWRDRLVEWKAGGITKVQVESTDWRAANIAKTAVAGNPKGPAPMSPEAAAMALRSCPPLMTDDAAATLVIGGLTRMAKAETLPDYVTADNDFATGYNFLHAFDAGRAEALAATNRRRLAAQIRKTEKRLGVR